MKIQIKKTSGKIEEEKKKAKNTYSMNAKRGCNCR